MSVIEFLHRQAPPRVPYWPGEYRVQLAVSAADRNACFRLREQVFCDEQGLFTGGDGDALDAQALHLAVLACCCGQGDSVVGTVRVHEREPGLWQGSRLAVAADYRQVAGLGSALIRHAVGLAKGLGARQFRAQVQDPNLGLFRRLHWQSLHPVQLQGRAHHWMQADLSRYAPVAVGEVSRVLTARRAA